MRMSPPSAIGPDWPSRFPYSSCVCQVCEDARLAERLKIHGRGKPETSPGKAGLKGGLLSLRQPLVGALQLQMSWPVLPP